MDQSLPVRVINPKRLGTWQLTADRVPLGEGYKPSMALLPTGELVLIALRGGRQLAGGLVDEMNSIWRSSDGGATWSDPMIVQDMIGREQWLTCTSDGTLFATSHILPRDVKNPERHLPGYHSYLHRSRDGASTWERTMVRLEGDERQGVPTKEGTTTCRNVIELPGGALLLGVALDRSDVCYMWRSDDGGLSWNRTVRSLVGSYRGLPYVNVDGFFSNSFVHRSDAGKLLHWIRVGPDYKASHPAPIYPLNDGRPVPYADDGTDRTVLCESPDDGKTWVNLRDFGDYGMMYMIAARLLDGRILLTFTQRALFYPLGLRATLSYDDGQTWDLSTDHIVIEGKTPWGSPSGGGFGGTLQMPDASLISCYSYRDANDRTQIEVVHWSLPD